MSDDLVVNVPGVLEERGRSIVVHETSVATSSVSEPANRRLTEVDGLRAIAVGLVVAFHFDLPPSGGFLGVDLFFAISGFVIARSLFDALFDGPPTGQFLQQFYRRRAARLLPALFLFVVGTLALAAVLGPSFGDDHRTVGHAFSALGGIGNWFVVFNPDVPGEVVRPFLHTWSLGVEEQFYLLFPLLLVLGRKRPHRTAFLICLLGIVAGLVTIALTRDPNVAYFVTTGRLPTMTFGVGLAALVDRSERYGAPIVAPSIQKLWARPVVRQLILLTVSLVPAVLVMAWDSSWSTSNTGVLSVVAFISVCAGIAGWLSVEDTNLASRVGGLLMFSLVPLLFVTPWDAGWLYAGGSVALGFIFTLIVAGSAFGGSGLVHRCLRSPLFQYVGQRSYSLYLWHFPFAWLFLSMPMPVRTVLRFGLSFALAELSYRFVERPLRVTAGRFNIWKYAPFAMLACAILSVPLSRNFA
jgi:peptidoglycan/LPS O-acetylase OafA/YrhL